MSISGRIFRLDAVDRVCWRLAIRTNLHSYLVGVGIGDEKCRFSFDALPRGTEMADSREQFRQLVGLLETTVCPRIAAATVRAMGAGERVRFAGIDVASGGMRRRRPFTRTVPWSQIVRADLEAGAARVYTLDKGVPAAEPVMAADMLAWNVVVLPRVVAALRTG